MRCAAIVGLLFAILGATSCKKTIHCETKTIKKVVFLSSLSTLKVPDTAAMVRKFNKTGGFGELSELFLPIKLTRTGLADRTMELPYKGEESYDYNWEIKLLPSGRMYYISKLEHENATSKTHYCTNGFSYTISGSNGATPTKDSSVVIPGNPYSTTPYTEPNIFIEYW